MKNYHEIEIKKPSEKSFGLVMATFFGLLGTYFYFKKGELNLFLMGFSGWLVVTSFFLPHSLKVPNLLWFKFGELLHRLISPLVIGFLFFVVLTPYSILLRLLGKDFLNLKKREEKTYWIKKDPIGPPPEGLKDQF